MNTANTGCYASPAVYYSLLGAQCCPFLLPPPKPHTLHNLPVRSVAMIDTAELVKGVGRRRRRSEPVQAGELGFGDGGGGSAECEHRGGRLNKEACVAWGTRARLSQISRAGSLGFCFSRWLLHPDPDAGFSSPLNPYPPSTREVRFSLCSFIKRPKSLLINNTSDPSTTTSQLAFSVFLSNPFLSLRMKSSTCTFSPAFSFSMTSGTEQSHPLAK